MNITTMIRKPKREYSSISLPYQIQIDKLQGIGNCPASAVMAALSVGKKIPAGTRDRKKAIAYILETYEIDGEWMRLLDILKDNKF